MIVTLEDLLEKVKSYCPDGLDKVKQAYEYADLLHRGQFRQIRLSRK